MFFRYKNWFQTLSFFLVVCLANGYVFAGRTENAVKSNDILFVGILTAFNALSVKVNGNPAQDGMTILSGAEITTDIKSGATINISGLGRVELNSETTVRLVFTAERIELQVLSGQAKLTTFKTITGELTGADGKTLTTDPALESSTIMSGEMINPGAVLPPPPAPASAGLGLWGTVASVSGIIGGAVSAWTAVTGSDSTLPGPVSRIQP